MLQFLMARSQEDGRAEEFHLKIENHLQMVKLLMETYQKLFRNNVADAKTLEQMKKQLESLNINMLRDSDSTSNNHLQQPQRQDLLIFATQMSLVLAGVGSLGALCLYLFLDPHL